MGTCRFQCFNYWTVIGVLIDLVFVGFGLKTVLQILDVYQSTTDTNIAWQLLLSKRKSTRSCCEIYELKNSGIFQQGLMELFYNLFCIDYIMSTK